MSFSFLNWRAIEYMADGFDEFELLPEDII
jgi:hypothetical protein